MKIAKKCGLAVILFTLLFTGCTGKTETDVAESESSSQVNPVESAVEEDVVNAGPVGEETLTSILDRDGSDGYTGDLVLVYNPMLQGGSKPMGNLDGLVETTENQVPTREEAYLQTSSTFDGGEDSYVTDEIRQADSFYDLTNGDLWQVGFQRVFNVDSKEMLFQVSAVGERCRVWSPVNPVYGPLEGIDPAYLDQLVREMDEAIPALEQVFGAIPDVRGDGKMNILCFDFNNPIALGFTSYYDIYEEIQVNGHTMRGNHLPIAYINTAPLIQGAFSDLSGSEIYTDVVHEMTHTIFAAQCSENGSMTMTVSKTLFNEFLAVIAQEAVYPGSAIHHSLSWWYSDKAVWEDLLADDADIYLRNQNNDRQSGKSLFQYTGSREDYAAMLLLACFAENRGGREFLMNITDYIDMNIRTIDIWEGLWKGLGYEDYSSFIEEFLLSILLHEEEGPYQLHPFEGYDPALWDGDENPFSHLKPIITDKGIYVGAGSYAVLRPVGGVYYPPATASKDLCYVGISWKPAE